MMGIFCAEWLKTKGGALRPLVFLLSPLVGAVLAWYVVGRPWIAAGSAFSGFFSVWAALVMPLALAIVAGQLVHEEEDAANFNGLLLCAKPRALLYLVKLALLLALAAVATGLAVGAFVLGLWLGGYASGGAMLYAEAGAVCWLAAIPLAALSLWLAFAFGMGVSIGSAWAACSLRRFSAARCLAMRSGRLFPGPGRCGWRARWRSGSRRRLMRRWWKRLWRRLVWLARWRLSVVCFS